MLATAFGLEAGTPTNCRFMVLSGGGTASGT